MKKPTLPSWPPIASQQPIQSESVDSPEANTNVVSIVRSPKQKPVRQARDRLNRMLVGVTPVEREEIGRRATIAGMSLSAYLRAAALNHPIRSTFDFQAIRDLLSVNGELHRFGAVLKLWLAERPDEGSPAADVARTLRETQELVLEIRQRIGPI